ncbi:flagellar assembly protein T N-terminal domain-containing protein [Chromobacterium sp. IIBBL 290-4]|uniref:flagellar assembly protein T N-terminal domain-containing protein n=1 Tax=Chromobacterium sp. IIBBL 290-4 TaxID=2953890 RepID=UPI0020B804C3|nr:flagellar assembly protein T N-terminal domain-containing protein [Chromobacterium sp. IIBBL 290-4]UTH74175.1 flagellar assembly protein FlgT [Chromobacterium sp. IIBBL 290-4]
MAEIYSAEGVAPLDNGAVTAREMAIRDALQLISIRQGATLESVQVLQNGRQSESGNLRPVAPVQGTMKVVKEFQQGKLYHVKVEVDTGSEAGAERRDPACAIPPGRSLRRRLVTTYFDVARPAEASDMSDLATALPTELSRRLSRNAQLMVRDANTISVLADSRVAEPAAGWDIASQLGLREDVQFVVAGRVLSSSITDKEPRPSFFESNNTSQQGAFYNGPFAGMFGMGVKYAPTRRQFDFEVWIYDGLTGSLLANERFGGEAKGEVVPKLPKPFASEAFWMTDYGKLINQLLNKAATRVDDVISCIPFSARIVKQEGKRIYINAGLLDGMAVGDKLLLYKRSTGQPVRDLISGRALGMPESLNGDVTLIQVQPNFSIGVAQGATAPVSDGDFVRFSQAR